MLVAIKNESLDLSSFTFDALIILEPATLAMVKKLFCKVFPYENNLYI